MPNWETQSPQCNEENGLTLKKIAYASQVAAGIIPAGGVTPPSVTIIPKGAANLATAQVTSTGTAATLVAARATRRSVLFRNVSASGSVWIGPATVTSSNGVELKAGESVPFTWVGLLQVIDNTTDHCVIAIADEYD